MLTGATSEKSMVHIGLENPKGTVNVGAVLRAVGCFSADGVFYTGLRYDYAARHCTDTKQMAQKIPLKKVDSLLDAKSLLPEGTQLVAVELVVGATPLMEFEHPEQAFYVFGPEDSSLPKALVRAADAVVYVPTIGCMNLAASVNVLLYDRLAKRGLSQGSMQGDELIKASRDNKNRLKIKSM